MKEQKNTQLWQEAKKRAEFKTHFSIYLIVNMLLWLVWFIGGGIHSHPWPIYPTVGWGIGILGNYFSVYRFTGAAEKEYEKLKSKYESQPVTEK